MSLSSAATRSALRRREIALPPSKQIRAARARAPSPAFRPRRPRQLRAGEQFSSNNPRNAWPRLSPGGASNNIGTWERRSAARRSSSRRASRSMEGRRPSPDCMSCPRSTGATQEFSSRRQLLPPRLAPPSYTTAQRLPQRAVLVLRRHPSPRQVFTLKAQAVEQASPGKGPQTFAKADIDVSKYATASPTSVSKTLDLVMETKARGRPIKNGGSILFFSSEIDQETLHERPRDAHSPAASLTSCARPTVSVTAASAERCSPPARRLTAAQPAPPVSPSPADPQVPRQRPPDHPVSLDEKCNPQ